MASDYSDLWERLIALQQRNPWRPALSDLSKRLIALQTSPLRPPRAGRAEVGPDPPAFYSPPKRAAPELQAGEVEDGEIICVDDELQETPCTQIVWGDEEIQVMPSAIHIP